MCQDPPVGTKAKMATVHPKATVGRGEFTNRINREQCGAHCLPYLRVKYEFNGAMRLHHAASVGVIWLVSSNEGK
jgi:hypothetical protein